MSALAEASFSAINTKMSRPAESTEKDEPVKKKARVSEVDGKMCHQCHQKRASFLRCTMVNPKTQRQCVGVFCEPCARRCYNIEFHEIPEISDKTGHAEDAAEPLWVCPICTKKCACAKCRKKRGLQPTGNVEKFANAKGISIAEVFADEELIKEAAEFAKAEGRKTGKAPKPVENDAEETAENAEPSAQTTLKFSAINSKDTPEKKKQTVFVRPQSEFKVVITSPRVKDGKVLVPKADVNPLKGTKKQKLEVEKKSSSASSSKSPSTSSTSSGSKMNQPTLLKVWATAPPTTNQAAAKPTGPAPVPVVEPPNFEKLEVSVTDDILEIRLDIRAAFFRFKRHFKLPRLTVSTLNNANGDWTTTIYKSLALATLKAMQADESPKNSRPWDTEDLYDLIKAIEKRRGDEPAFWSGIQEFFPDVIPEGLDYEEELDMCTVVRALQYLFCQSSIARKQLASDVDLAKEKHRAFTSERNALLAEMKTMEGTLRDHAKVKLGMLEFEEWYVQRQLAPRLPAFLGKDALGNEYYFFNQDTWNEDNWGHWLIVKKSPTLPHPSGKPVEDEDDLTWFCIYTSKEANALGDWLSRQAYENAKDEGRYVELKALAKVAYQLGKFYDAEEKAAEMGVEISNDLSKGI